MKNIVVSIFNELVKSEGTRHIECKIAELPDVFADGVSIKQVWENLISNALKYSRHKETTIIDIGYELHEVEIIYCIRDNGAGFDMNYYNSLFKVFKRLHSQHEFEGTGVGLAIVERIILKHGGKIWAEGNPGHGATFYFSLPKF